MAASPSKQRMFSDQRRDAIVKAAVQLFARNGFRGTTTRELAQAVGVTEPVLYMHFATKRDLYSAIIERLAHGDEGLAETDDPLAMNTTEDATFFMRLAEEILRWHVEDPSRIRILLYSALEGHELSDLFRQHYILPFLEAFTAYIRRRIEE